jgi:hypothetical protein
VKMVVQFRFGLEDSPVPNGDWKSPESTSSIPSADGLDWLGE